MKQAALKIYLTHFTRFLKMDKEPMFQYCIVSIVFIKLTAETGNSIGLAKFTNR